MIGATVTVILGAVLLSIICTGSMPRKKTNVLSLFKTYAYLIKNSNSCSRFQKHKVGKNIVFITLGLCFGSSTLLSFLFLVFGLLFVFFLWVKVFNKICLCSLLVKSLIIIHLPQLQQTITAHTHARTQHQPTLRYFSMT